MLTCKKEQHSKTKLDLGMLPLPATVGRLGLERPTEILDSRWSLLLGGETSRPINLNSDKDICQGLCKQGTGRHVRRKSKSLLARPLLVL